MNMHKLDTLSNNALLFDYEAAEILRLSKSTLNTWRVIGKGPSYLKVGGRVRYKAGDLREWLEKCQHGI